MKEYLPEFFDSLENTLKEDSKKTIDPVIEFEKFLTSKSREGGLPPEYDEFSDDDLHDEAEKLRSQILEWPDKNDIQWMEKLAPNRWRYRGSGSQTQKRSFSSPHLGNQPSDIREILKKNASSVDNDELDKLRDYVKNLKSRDRNSDDERVIIADVSYFIANISYRVEQTEINAGEWLNAGRALAKIDKDKAYESFRKASELYSILLKHSESALALDEALCLRCYSKLDDEQKSSYKRDLIDCQVQHSRAGNNGEASSKYIEANNLKSSEANWWSKPFYKLFKLTSDYGENPGKVVMSAFLVILAATLFYWCLGIKSGVDELGNIILEKDFWTALYFSLVTFTTLGYGDYSPVGFVRIIATVQAISGLILTSLFMVTLVRKHSR